VLKGNEGPEMVRWVAVLVVFLVWLGFTVASLWLVWVSWP
jgi:hypothetical protein